MSSLTHAVEAYGLPLVMLVVLLEQLGLPIPAMPVLIVAGALAVDGKLVTWQVLLGAVAASVVADSLWFGLGRLQGNRILKTLCRVSLSPDSCVRQTESVFERWGMPSLLVAKFIPGFSTVAPPMAGAVGARLPAFLLFDSGGALLWAGAGVVAGAIFHRAVDRVISAIASLGSSALVLLGAGLAAFIAVKWWQRRRFYKMLRMARISVDDLHRLMDEGKSPVVVDVRTAGARSRDPRRIPGAAVMEAVELDARLVELPRDREIILYCT
ncbi:MAG TPA: VTT domain-containing protein [Thermoanaerobaculia bacterium]|jgi:membrane protein DedA with SNARE-associated domain|nr:VTT domain-containing protein [Thermoanaerobaculia bacterium]